MGGIFSEGIDLTEDKLIWSSNCRDRASAGLYRGKS